MSKLDTNSSETETNTSEEEKDGFFRRLMENKALKDKLYNIIFESDTPAGKRFDVTLMIMIVLSVTALILESMPNIGSSYKRIFIVLEYVFTAFFTFEYVVRIYCSPHAKKYIFSFFGIIDLLSILPVYLSFVLGSAHYMLAIRVFRLIRVFRVFKLFNFLEEGHSLLEAVIDSSRRIIVYFIFVLIMVVSIGTIMFMIEGNRPGSGFTDIPTSIYWAIVTMTTVGYGDITPITLTGRVLSAIVMLLGYTIIAVPTGIVASSMSKTRGKKKHVRVCQNCQQTERDEKALFCKYCGCELAREDEEPAKVIIEEDDASKHDISEKSDGGNESV